ncbi:MAG: heme-binding protein [Candidatus Gracilibacteria bacterium]|nr:heme-binding protein [Candidatus Gracilibacteria bacterium]
MKFFQFSVSTFMALGVFIGILAVFWIAWGYFSILNIEMPKYTVLEQRDGYEIREYDAYIIAETTIDGDFEKGMNSGFMVVADYIFGNNKKNESISMTSPVSSDVSESIAMTSPVTSDLLENIAMTSPVVSGETEGKRTTAFVMPSKYSLETLPIPNNDAVKIREIPQRKVAVYSFGGWYRANSVEQRRQELLSLLDRDGLKYGKVSFAGYNPPWTPPFMMRNEIWAELVD